MRVTWVQPEDLVGHELVQAAQDGRDPHAVRAIADRWAAAGGHPAPPRAGASPSPAPPALRRLAGRLLDELDALPAASGEPDDLAAIRARCPGWVDDLGVPDAAGDERLPDRLHGAWLGRAVGCVLGKPVEKVPREGIREIAQATGNWPITGYFTEVGLPDTLARRWPWNRRSRWTSLAENIDGMPEDDDLNYPLLALLLTERHGRDFTTGDVAQLWLDELPAGRTFTAERAAYRNLLLGLTPPDVARHHNPFREWIGAQIRADVFGWINPGRPGAAAELAWRDARLTHTANGVYGAMFAAALGAACLVLDDPEAVVRAGRSVVPDGSRLARALDLAVTAAHEEEPGHEGWERVTDRIAAAHPDLHWVHVLHNAALVAAALVHGRGDFSATIARVVAGGWDTDSDGATVGGVVGAITGAAGIPARWTEPLHDRLATSIADLDGVTFTELARRTRALVEHG